MTTENRPDTTEQAPTTAEILARLACCPRCGSGDVGWCQVSVRPYCRDCGMWAPINMGSADDAIHRWNERARAAGHDVPGQ